MNCKRKTVKKIRENNILTVVFCCLNDDALILHENTKLIKFQSCWNCKKMLAATKISYECSSSSSNAIKALKKVNGAVEEAEKQTNNVPIIVLAFLKERDAVISFYSVFS